MAELSNEEANEPADEILLRSEFIGAREPGVFTRAVNRVIEEIGEFISRFLGTLFGGAGGGAGSAIAFVLLGVAVLVIVYALYRAWVTRRADRVEDDGPVGARVVFDEVVDPEHLRHELAGRRAAADWRGAVIAGFRLVVLELIDRRLAFERPGATTGDFGRDLTRSSADLTPAYSAAADSFERAFYSDNVIDERDFDRVDSLLAQLMAAAVR